LRAWFGSLTWGEGVMSESWLEIGDEKLDAREVERRVEERLARREAGTVHARPEFDVGQGRPRADLQASDARSEILARWEQDCDLVPAHYEIDWRVPVIGRIHAAVRRVINAEIRRFLFPSLVKQSHLNRAVLRLLRDLEDENAQLRQELAQLYRAVEDLRRDREPDREDGTCG
jgi:hypothetical protein